MLAKITILFTIFLFNNNVCSGREIKFRKLAMCPGSRNLPLQFDKVVIQKNEKGVTTAVDFVLTVKRQVNRLTIIVCFWKCDSSEHLDSCEYFLKDYNSTSICEIMGEKHQLWTAFMEHFTMPNTCPIKVGKYYLKDGPIHNGYLNYLPIPNAYWKLNFKGYDESSRYLSCVDVEFEVYSGRGLFK